MEKEKEKEKEENIVVSELITKLIVPEDKIKELETLFLTDGITHRQAAQIVGVSKKDAKLYYEIFAKELTDDDGHETYVVRQKRVRARALEGLSKKILFVTDQRHVLNTVLYSLTHDSSKHILDPDEISHRDVIAYSAQVSSLTTQLTTLQNEYDSIDAIPPADIILRQELQQLKESVVETK